MSFEGYYQLICDKGHYFNENDISRHPESLGCTVDSCDANVAWWNLVNTTNGSYEGKKRIDGYIELEMLSKPIICKCNKCKNIHVNKVAVYKIPKGGHKVGK